MKVALDNTQSPIEASSNAPDQARCPHCGARVVLRHRRRSSRRGDETWFWRHEDHAGAYCPARFEANAVKRILK